MVHLTFNGFNYFQSSEHILTAEKRSFKCIHLCIEVLKSIRILWKQLKMVLGYKADKNEKHKSWLLYSRTIDCNTNHTKKAGQLYAPLPLILIQSRGTLVMAYAAVLLRSQENTPTHGYSKNPQIIQRDCSWEFEFSSISSNLGIWFKKKDNFNYNDQYAICTSPMMHLISHFLKPAKFCITFVFHFSWVLQPSQEKLKTMFKKILGANKVHYGRCASGVWA